MNILRLFSLMLAMSLFLISSVVIANPDQPQDANKLEERLKRLEPDVPKDITDPPFFQSPFPLKVKPAQDIIKNGRNLPYKVLLDKPNWQRPAYKSFWHSSVSGGRWSCVPNRIHYAMHRLFTAPTAALSNYYDFIHNLGLDEELANVQAQPQNADRERFIGQIIVVVMQAKIERVITRGNQVVLVARPQRNGVQALTVNKMDMRLDNPNEAVLFQLVTLNGDEIDYSLL
ncbi:hypothetical protein [Paenibacillus sp. GP183]|uniref:hypothetical protein n=1 Tax=Paenibacillus sp. GP183 TaxID=1882751 RepID=UPI00089690ED|nr:hypothetical protein [Paenibacillus sp. GP183]SEB45825.1 hypothetical protein SAMN05443246_0462 [Paenibacillus sp. GP183]